jgi:hypothetical protein
MLSLQTEEASMHYNGLLGKPENARQAPWNKGKLIGSRPPTNQDVWSILTKLQAEECTRDSAIFNLAIYSKPRGCDMVRLKIADVARMA